MAQAKSFDCVELKNRIQRELLERWQGLTDEQIREAMQRDLDTSDAPAAKLWRSIRARSSGRPTEPAA